MNVIWVEILSMIRGKFIFYYFNFLNFNLKFRVKKLPGNKDWLPNFPEINIPGGGSDHLPFLTYLGIPVVDFRYFNVSDSYPLYHTLYETPFINEHLFDIENFAVNFLYIFLNFNYLF